MRIAYDTSMSEQKQMSVPRKLLSRLIRELGLTDVTRELAAFSNSAKNGRW